MRLRGSKCITAPKFVRIGQMVAKCEQQLTLLLSLDISASFDTIDLSVLLGPLMLDFGIIGHDLNWLRSCVKDHTQYVCVGTAHSTIVDCTSGVPQGSVLRPLLFAVVCVTD